MTRKSLSYIIGTAQRAISRDFHYKRRRIHTDAIIQMLVIGASVYYFCSKTQTGDI